jgi:hypothetical protein
MSDTSGQCVQHSVLKRLRVHMLFYHNAHLMRIFARLSAYARTCAQAKRRIRDVRDVRDVQETRRGRASALDGVPWVHLSLMNLMSLSGIPDRGG